MAVAFMSTGQASCPKLSGARCGSVSQLQHHLVAPRNVSHLTAGFSGREEPRHFPVSHAYGPKVASLETQEKMVSLQKMGYCCASSTPVLLSMRISCIASLQDPFATKEEYKDSWFDKFMVNYFAKQMSKQLGGALALFYIPLHLHCYGLGKTISLTDILPENPWSRLVVGYQACPAGNVITADMSQLWSSQAQTHRRLPRRPSTLAPHANWHTVGICCKTLQT